MAKRTLKSEALTISGTVVDTLFVGVSLSCGVAFLSNPNPWLAAGAIVPAIATIRRNWPQSYPGKQERKTLRHITNLAVREVSYSVPDLHAELDDQFYFRGLGLPVAMPETRFLEFVKIARRRQTNAIYGTKYTMQWTGKTFRQIKINWVLSEGYFTQRHYPRFLFDEYWACMLILGYTRLLEKKGQGDAGHLVGDRGVNWYVNQAKEKWLRLLDHPTPRGQLSQLIGRFKN